METETFNYYSIRKIIEDGLTGRGIDINNRDREELLSLLNDVEEFDDTLCFDLISGTEGPIAIQVFTDVEYNGKTFPVIIDFEMLPPNSIDDLVNTLLDEYKKAIETRNFFNS